MNFGHRIITPVSRRNDAGFTLTEIMFASGLFGLLMGVVLSLYVFTMKSVSGVAERLKLNQQAGMVDFITRDIKQAQQLAVGSYNGSAFVPIPMGSYLQGKALSVLLPDDPNPAVQVYYWVDNDGRLLRTTPATLTSKLLLQNVTNNVVFAMTDCNGVTVSNLLDRLIVKIDLNTRDANTRDFRQTLNIHSTATKRN